MQASVCRALQRDHTVRQAYVDRHFAAGVPPDTTRWMTTLDATVHAADRHARTGGPGAQAAGADLTLMFRGTV